MATLPKLHFKKIFDPLGSYGDAYEDVTRWGEEGHRFQLKGKRGPRQTVRGIQFFGSFSGAKSAMSSMRGYKGQQVTLENDLDNSSYTVFLHEITVHEPEKVNVAGLTNVEARLTAELEITVLST